MQTHSNGRDAWDVKRAVDENLCTVSKWHLRCSEPGALRLNLLSDVFFLANEDGWKRLQQGLGAARISQIRSLAYLGRIRVLDKLNRLGNLLRRPTAV